MIPAVREDETAVVVFYVCLIRTKVENLYGSTVHLERSGDSGECGEVNLGCLRVGAGEFGHQGRLNET